MNVSSHRAKTRFLAAVVTALGLPAFAAEPELPVGAIGRLGAHRFVHADRVRWLGFVAGDRRIFAQSDDNTFCIWDLDSGDKVWQPTRETHGSLARAQISADGSVVVVAASGKNIGVMRTADPTSICWLTGAADRSRDLAVAGEGAIAASCDGSDILVWNTARGAIERRLSVVGSARAVALSRDGRLLAGGGDSSVRLWQMADGKQIGEWSGSAYTLCFDADARFLVASVNIRLSDSLSRDSLKLISIPEGREQWEVVGSFGPVVCSPDGTQLAVPGYRGITMFDSATGKLSHCIAYDGNEPVSAMAYSRDGQLLATGGDDARIRLWRTTDWTEVNKGSGHEGPVQCLAFSPDGQTLATGGRDRSIRLWAWREGRELRNIPKVGQHWGIDKVAFSPDSAKLASLTLVTVAGAPQLTLWNVASGAKLLSIGAYYSRGLAFSVDGRELLTGMEDGSIAMWSSETGSLVRQFGKRQRRILEVVTLPGERVAWMGEFQGLGLRDLSGSFTKYTNVFI